MKRHIFIVILLVSNISIAQNSFIGINTNVDLSKYKFEYEYNTNDLPKGFNFSPGIGILFRFEKKRFSQQVAINFDKLFIDYVFRFEKNTSSHNYTYVDYYLYYYSSSYYYMSIKPSLYFRLTNLENPSSVYLIEQLYYGRMLYKNVRDNTTEIVTKEGSSGNYTYTTNIINSGADPQNEREVLLSNNIGVGFDTPLSEKVKLSFSFFVYLPFISMYEVAEKTDFYFDDTFPFKKQFSVNVSILFRMTSLYSIFLSKANP